MNDEIIFDRRLEEISDKIRAGEPVGVDEAIEAIEYQQRRREYSKASDLVWIFKDQLKSPRDDLHSSGIIIVIAITAISLAIILMFIVSLCGEAHADSTMIWSDRDGYPRSAQVYDWSQYQPPPVRYNQEWGRVYDGEQLMRDLQFLELQQQQIELERARRDQEWRR